MKNQFRKKPSSRQEAIKEMEKFLVEVKQRTQKIARSYHGLELAAQFETAMLTQIQRCHKDLNAISNIASQAQ